MLDFTKQTRRCEKLHVSMVRSYLRHRASVPDLESQFDHRKTDVCIEFCSDHPGDKDDASKSRYHPSSVFDGHVLTLGRMPGRGLGEVEHGAYSCKLQ